MSILNIGPENEMQEMDEAADDNQQSVRNSELYVDSTLSNISSPVSSTRHPCTSACTLPFHSHSFIIIYIGQEEDIE